MVMFELVAKREHLRSKGLLIVLHRHTETTTGVKAVIFQKHNWCLYIQQLHYFHYL